MVRRKKFTALAIGKWSKPKHRVEHPDPESRGLYLIHHPSGHKSWAMRFRGPDGKIAKLTLGEYTDAAVADSEKRPRVGMPLTINRAHQLAAIIKEQRGNDVDPVAERKAAKLRERNEALQLADNSFPKLADLYIREGRRKKKSRKGIPRNRGWRATAQVLGLNYDTDDESSLIPGGLAEKWKNKQARDVTDEEALVVIDEARDKGIPGRGIRTKESSEARKREMAAALGGMFRWLRGKRLVPTNPCLGITVEPSEERTRVLVKTETETPDTTELRWLLGATNKLADPFKSFVKALVLTGQRRNEVARMRIEELSPDRTLWTIPGHRAKNGIEHKVPLSPQAQAIVRKQIGGKGDKVQRLSGFVFSTTKGESPISGFSKLKIKIDKLVLAEACKKNPKVEIENWVFHDLRRTAVTVMAGVLGVDPHIADAAINHVSEHKSGVAGIYNRAEYAKPKREALEAWADFVEGLVKRKAA